MARSMAGLIRVALTGVEMMVTFCPCCANSLAMSVMGIRWPEAMKGISTK